MSAQDYWNNGQNNTHQNNSYQQHNQSNDGYPSQYGQDQSYQSHQQPSYNQDNEPMNWGYGGGNQQQQQSHQSQGYYDSQNSQYNSQQYSYDQNKGYDQGYSQPHQGYPQPHDSYQTHNTYNTDQYSSQHVGYSNQTDYNRQASPNPYPTSDRANQGYPPQTTMQDTYPGGPTPAEGERGLLGALGGAAAGGFAGHKVNHGFIGAVGGAYAGHKLEEHLKDEKKKKKDKDSHRPSHSSSGGHHSHSRNSRRGSSSSSSSSSSDSSDDEKKRHKKKHGSIAVAGAGAASAAAYASHQGHNNSRDIHGLAGNFSSSSTQISLDRDYDLIASCSTLGGHPKLSSISLNDCLTNSWGELRWARGGGFRGSARRAHLIEDGRVLEAELGDGRGGWKTSRIRLDERITNNDGDLQFLA